MNTTDKLMALITDFGAASLRLGSYERKDSYESSAKASWQTIAFREKREVARQAVRAEIEALARDAERYRWLRSDDIEVIPGQREISVVMHRLPFSDGPDETLTESALDAAIDAAMQEKQS